MGEVRVTTSVRLLDTVLARARTAARGEDRSLSRWLERLIVKELLGAGVLAPGGHEFVPSRGNALRCECGLKKGEH